MQLLLASNSPRRRELLRLIAPDYGIAAMHDIDESYPSDLKPEDVPLFLSQLKARAYAAQLKPGQTILTADTVVINDGKILGKPHSREQAVEMLLSLMGRTHKVVTGVTLSSIDHTESFAETTEVTFDSLSRAEIEQYVDNYRPYDKAGAYGIQEWIGCAGISQIRGCFYNVMGLPLHALYKRLKAFPS